MPTLTLCPRRLAPALLLAAALGLSLGCAGTGDPVYDGVDFLRLRFTGIEMDPPQEVERTFAGVEQALLGVEGLRSTRAAYSRAAAIIDIQVDPARNREVRAEIEEIAARFAPQYTLIIEAAGAG